MNRSFAFLFAAIAAFGLQLTFGLASNAQSGWTSIAQDPKAADGKPEAGPIFQQPKVDPPSMPRTNPIADPQVRIAIQEVPTPTLPTVTAPPLPPLPPDDGLLSSLLSSPVVSRIYARADYMLWWAKAAPLGVPLISTGPISTTHHGWLDNPDSTILYGAPFPGVHGGKATQNFPAFSGGRLTLGYWLDDDQHFAIEGSGFMLARRTVGYEIRSDANGYPDINIPVYNTVISNSIPGLSTGISENGLPASLYNDPMRADGNAGVFSGGVKITNTLRLWGSDGAAVVRLYRDAAWEFSGLLGFQYLDLAESFHLAFDSTGVSGHYLGETGAASDTFQTRNQFYGADLGVRGRYSNGPLSVEATARVALGGNHEVENVWGGYYSFNFLKPFATGPEGVFAQPANEGRRSANRFAAVPEAQLKVAYAVTPQLRLTAGYDFLFWSSVLRPGDQINRNLPKGQTFQQDQTAASTTSPAPYFNTTHFYAHGVSLGIDFRY